jgi:hypothetical protein
MKHWLKITPRLRADGVGREYYSIIVLLGISLMNGSTTKKVSLIERNILMDVLISRHSKEAI